MATKVFSVEVLELQDGKKVQIAPLPVKPLREFMKIYGKLKDAKDEDSGIEIMFDAAVFALTRRNEVTEDELEESLDLPTMMKVLEVCGGLNFADPNLLAAATE